jgi:hypothetical protein
MPQSYPTDLPKPKADLRGSSLTPVVRTEMDTGRIRQLQKYGTKLRRWGASWDLTGAEFTTFKTFFDTTLKGGTLYFTLALPTSGGSTENVTVRFANGEYSHNYVTYDRWGVSGELEEEIVQTVADPAGNPSLNWYRPEILLVGNITIDPTIHRNALFKANPGEGVVYNVTVPAIATVADQVPIGVMMTGPGAVHILTGGEDPGGGGGTPPPPDWKATGVALGPMGLWDWSQASSAGSPARVTTCADSSGNGKTVTHNGGTNKLAGTKQGNYLQFAGAECFLDHLTSFTPASTDKREFHYFCVFQLWSPGRNANAKVDQWLLGGAVNTYGRPAFGVKNSDYVANLWSFEHSNSTDISYYTRPACMLMKDVMQVLEVRSIKNGSGCDQTVWLDGFLLGTFSADTTDITGFRMMMGVKHLNANPAAQYMRIRTTAVFDPANLTLGQAATFRDALMANFATVDAYA